MRHLLFFLLAFSLATLAAQPCHTNVDVTGVKVSYSANNGTSIEGTFTNLSPLEFKIEYKNLTDRGSRWKTTINPTYGSNRRWYVHGLQPAKEYKLRFFVKYYTRWCEVDMHHIWTNLNTADFNLNGQNTGTVSICGNEPITMNAAASKYEDSYGIAIREIDRNGSGIGNELLREFRGCAPNGIDLRQFTSQNQFPLIGGKRYYVKLFTKPNWQEKIMFLDLKAASVSLRPSANKVPNTADQYYACVRSGTPQLTIDTRASACEVRYKIKVVEMNGNQEVPGSVYDQWIEPFTPLPALLDVAAIYNNRRGSGFQVGKQYKVVIAVGFPWAAQHFYVRFYRLGDCPAYPQKQKRAIGL